MKITGFVWLETITEKLWYKHKVEPEEVEELFNGKYKLRFVEKGDRHGENLYAAYGQTEDGRYLIIFFIYKRNRKALIVSARNMTRTERKRYDQK